MEAIELVKISRSLMETMSRIGIKATDYRHIELFDEYMKMRRSGYKVAYIEAVLSDRYRISPRSISRIVSRFKRHVKP